MMSGLTFVVYRRMTRRAPRSTDSHPVTLSVLTSMKSSAAIPRPTLSALFLMALLMTSSQASELRKFFCVPDKAIGFSWDGTSWVHSNFRVGDEKYLVEEIPPPMGTQS